MLCWWSRVNKFPGNHHSDPDWRTDGDVKRISQSNVVPVLQLFELIHLLSQETVMSRSEAWVNLMLTWEMTRRMGLRDYMEGEGWLSVFLTLSPICGRLNWIYSLRDPLTESEAQPNPAHKTSVKVSRSYFKPVCFWMLV